MAGWVQVEAQLRLDGCDTLFKMQGFIGTDTAACACVGVGPSTRDRTHMPEDTRSTSNMSPLTFQIKLDLKKRNKVRFTLHHGVVECFFTQLLRI